MIKSGVRQDELIADLARHRKAQFKSDLANYERAISGISELTHAKLFMMAMEQRRIAELTPAQRAQERNERAARRWAASRRAMNTSHNCSAWTAPCTCDLH